jgi:cell division protein FtsL
VPRPAPRSLRIHGPAARAGLTLRLPSAGKLLDSIVRGRAWIPMLGVLLVGIVGMRVEVLKLGSSVGTEMQQASQLESANAVMLKQVSALSGNQRIEQLATKQGMVMPLPLDLHFVKASGSGNVSRAIADVRPPSPATFLSSLVDERQKDGASVVAAENTSAIGVQGGGAITGGTGDLSTSGAAAGSTQITTLTLANSGDGSPTSSGVAASSGDTTTSTGTAGADTTSGADTAATQTPSSGADAAGQGASSASDSAATGATSDSGATDATDATDATSTAGATGNAGAADNVPPVTNTDNNGAASLAG